uniref:Uncharacterized protein n=1 Tax=Oryza barthii TaxID=65489 RepID=A0A0D3HPH8_9ORYZ
MTRALRLFAGGGGGGGEECSRRARGWMVQHGEKFAAGRHRQGEGGMIRVLLGREGDGILERNRN